MAPAAAHIADPARRLAWSLGRGGGPLERLATARALAAMGDRAANAVGDLAALLVHRDAEIVSAGAFVLAELGPLAFRQAPELPESLAALIEHPAADVRLWAAQAIARDPEPGAHAIEALAVLMGDADPAVRHAAIEGAGRMGTAAAALVESLAAAALHGGCDIARAARRALPAVASEWPAIENALAGHRAAGLPLILLAARYAAPGNAAEAAVLAFLETAEGPAWRAAADELDGLALTERIAAHLAERLASPAAIDRMTAAAALGRVRTGRRAATEALLARTAGDPACGWAVGCALVALWHGDIMPPDVEAGLAALLAAPAAPGDTLILLAAMQELAYTPAGCATALGALARHRHDALRCAAVQALGGLAAPGPDALDALTCAVDDTRRPVRIAACRSLAALGADRAPLVERLAREAREGAPGERVKAMGAIAVMGIEAEAASPELEAALRDPNPAVREAAAAALGHIEAVNF